MLKFVDVKREKSSLLVAFSDASMGFSRGTTEFLQNFVVPLENPLSQAPIFLKNKTSMARNALMLTSQLLTNLSCG